MRDIQIRSNPLSAPSNVNSQNASSRGVDVQALSEVFQRSLKSASDEATPEQTPDAHPESSIAHQVQEHSSDLTMVEKPADSAGQEDSSNIRTAKHSVDLPCNASRKEETELLGSGSSGFFPTINDLAAQNTPAQLTITTASTDQFQSSSNTVTVTQAVASLLEKMDQLHRMLGAKRWQFEWLNGSAVKLSLSVSRSADGEYKASISDCESDFTREEFLGELNRRLEEKQYQVTVTNNHDELFGE